jgi:uncharacterized protein YggE
MKSRAVSFFGFAGAVLVLIAALAAWTSGEPLVQGQRLITVTGNAQIRAVPDEVLIALGVETWHKDLDRAKSENDEIIARLLGTTSNFDIGPEHVQTDYVSIEPRYRNGYYEERDFIGYFVRNTVLITLRDLSKFEGLLTGALEAGVNYVHGVEFRTTELRKHKDEARALAIRAAQEKAVAMAGELDQKVGQPQSIQELQEGWRPSYSSWWGSPWSSAMTQNVVQELSGAMQVEGGTLAPGQIGVNASVSVSFLLEG